MSRPVVAAVLAALVLLLGLAPAAGALSPSESIVFYRPGKAVTGVLLADRFVRKGSFRMSGVTAAAASRSSLALYSRDTGRLRTGTFRGGVFTLKETVTIRSGFTHVAASCDSILFYNTNTGRILTGTLNGGRLRNRSSGFLAPGWQELAASCDTAWFVKPGSSSSSVHELGVLQGGDYAKQQDATDGTRTVTGMTDTSWFALRGDGLGDWGPVANGSRSFDGAYGTEFTPGWTHVVGTATRILFYMPTGLSCIWGLVNGVADTTAPCGNLVSPGWAIIAGGR